MAPPPPRWCAGAAWPRARKRNPSPSRSHEPPPGHHLAEPICMPRRNLMPAPTTMKPTRRFRPVEVVAVRQVTPRLVTVALGGDALEGFEIAAPTQHVKLLFPAPGEDAPALPEFGPDGL